MAGAHRLRRRERLRFVVWLIVVGAPIITVVVLGFEIGPFLRLLAAHIYFVPFVTRRCRHAGGPVAQ